MTHGSLFSGVGGGDLAAQWAGWENLFHCEINPFGRKILDYYWPKSTSYADIINTDFSIWRGRIDVLTGGFPCQPMSVAGSRKGTDDHRYLWPQMRRVYNEIKPRIIVAENVTGILSMEDKTGVWKEIFAKVENRQIARYTDCDNYEALYTRQSKMLINTILENLEKDGYEAVPIIIPAAAIGAPHRRYRVWIIGYAKHDGLYGTKVRRDDTQSPFTSGTDQVRESSGATGIQSSDYANPNGLDGDLSGFRTGGIPQQQETGIQPDHAENANENGRRGVIWQEEADIGQFGNLSSGDNGRICADHEETRDVFDSDLTGREECNTTAITEEPEEWNRKRITKPTDPWKGFPVESAFLRGDDELSSRLDGIAFSTWRNESIKGYGNAWVPALAYEIFKTINEYESSLQ